MAEVRKSAKQTEARRRAREKAAEFRARQDKLEQLAVDYFVAADTLDDIDEAMEKEIAAVRAFAEQQRSTARRNADDVMQKMLGLGITRAEVAERLGVSVRDVKKAPTERAGATSSSKAAQLPEESSHDDEANEHAGADERTSEHEGEHAYA
ncbi:hypothetical protein [Curtobacterium sp. MCBD17_003]|uniref:hypothetical protein n=1 Tax=Curtobacterium sp. MCBD17_003 TaxID=2175667 RepID=UPI000DAA4EB7|nr:hypothetical protein [Curtobacterium sp. MCBD17_003]WIE56320.1 hypothetical protein DEI88_016155 [Curtobacterium sp. MCBD17_003]